jgi:hypothetical protein
LRTWPFESNASGASFLVEAATRLHSAAARMCGCVVVCVPAVGSTSLAGLSRHGRRDQLEGFQLNDRWDDEEATGLLRAALAEIDALSDELSPARAEALLDEFERDVGSAFLRQDLPDLRGVPASLSWTRERREVESPKLIVGLKFANADQAASRS